ncbi:hypothetical protein EPICR_30006 [Candidatus Desulfarcum epimagneticum]|uniref:Uncharacterized protein n=1 Tax=uncultured Desulfobacteraceae bacterium TaxID=218296 RepID=A0A484HKH2_9BACT|nr:hypothetical protein EPICR_30006 [uncultured Desulfobacteraceae bacterium]
MGEDLSPFNSKKLNSACDEFKHKLLNEEESLKIFKLAQNIFESSGIELDKKQYKSEGETDLIIKAFRTKIGAGQ